MERVFFLLGVSSPEHVLRRPQGPHPLTSTSTLPPSPGGPSTTVPLPVPTSGTCCSAPIPAVSFVQVSGSLVLATSLSLL